MLWIDGLVVLLVAVIMYFIFCYYSFRKTTAGILTVIIVVLSVSLMYLFFVPYNFISTNETKAPKIQKVQYETKIKTLNPFFDLVKDKSPNEYNVYISKIKENIIAKGDLSNEIYYQSDFINALLIKYGPNASNQSLYNYLKSSVNQDRNLIKINPVLVIYHEFPEKFTNQKIDSKNLNVDEYKNNVLNAAEPVIISGIAQAQPLPTANETKNAMIIFREVIGDLSKKYGSKKVVAVLQQPNNPSLDKKQAAEIVIAFMDGIIAKGQDNAALFLRATLITNRPKEVMPAKKHVSK